MLNNLLPRYLFTSCILFLLLLAGFHFCFNYLPVPRGVHDLAAQTLYFKHFIIDFLVFALVSGWLLTGPRLLRWMAYLLFILFYLFNIIQLVSVYATGRFLSKLAVANSNHLSLLMAPSTIALLAMLLLAVYCLIRYFSVAKLSSSKFKTMALASILLVAAHTVISKADVLIGERVKQQVYAYTNHPDAQIPNRSPIKSLHQTLFKEKQYSLQNFTHDEITALNGFGITLDAQRPHPFIKQQIYAQPTPFNKTNNALQKPNILVLFAEGLSARSTSVYSDKFGPITPSFEGFAEQAMVVDNYYNHTYATYRGLAGQFCSFFPVNGGGSVWQNQHDGYSNNNLFCLPNLLAQLGYHTEFLDTHRQDAAFIDEMVSELGFAEVQVAETLSPRFLDGQAPLRDDALSDQQLFAALIGRLQSLEGQATVQTQPFFMAQYNLGTHAFQDAAKDGIRFAKANNAVLHNIHNFDNGFGRFWEYFKQSPWYHNTVVILTSDHCHYHERAFSELFTKQDNYQPLFVDTIPLMIYSPYHDLPSRYDAQSTTSLNFAPSLLHLLELYNGRNGFLGQSIFSADKPTAQIAAADAELYTIRNNQVRFWNDSDAGKYENTALDPEQILVGKFIARSYRAELEKRLWDGASISNN